MVDTIFLGHEWKYMQKRQRKLVENRNYTLHVVRRSITHSKNGSAPKFLIPPSEYKESWKEHTDHFTRWKRWPNYSDNNYEFPQPRYKIL